MPKIRIHELAKEMDVSSKLLLDKLHSYGKDAKNHMSSIEDDDAKRLMNDFGFNQKPSGGVNAAEKDISAAEPEKPKTQAEAESQASSDKPSAEAGSQAPAAKASAEVENQAPAAQPKADEANRAPKPRVDANGRPLPPRPRVDAEGRPLPPRPRLDADGRPLPPKPRVDAEGRVLKPKPRLDADGRPLPPRPRVDAEGRPLPPRPKVDAEGRPLRLRPKLDAEGRPLPPKPRVDAEGRPLPPRPRVDAEGHPLPPRPRVDAEGRPLPPRPRVDAEGRPLPPRPRLDAEGRPLPPRPKLDAEGRPMKPRPKVDADGRPLPPRPRVDAEGRPLLPRPRVDAEGRPLPPRPRVDAEGRPIKPRPWLELKSQATASKTSAETETANIEKTVEQPPVIEDVKVEAANETMPVEESTTTEPITKEETQIGPQPQDIAPQVEVKADDIEPKEAEQPNLTEKSETEEIKEQASETHAESQQQKPTHDGRPPRPAKSDHQAGRPERKGPGTFQNRSDGQRQGTFRSQTGPRPGAYQGQGQGQSQGQRDGASRPAAIKTGVQRKDGFKARPGAPDAGRGGTGTFQRPATSPRPGFPAKKEDKKTAAEPTKDDRKQDWKKNEQMRSVKSKVKSEAEKKENKKILERKDGHGRRGFGKPKEARAAAKKIIPLKVEPPVTMITVQDEIIIRDLAEKLRKSNADVIKILMRHGVMATANQSIDFNTAVLVAEEFDVLVDEYVEVDVFKEAFLSSPDEESELMERPPVVVVMGHVDHGKTSLLDAIRDTSVMQTEAGGITQHIGAYTVSINGKPITFLDTPGHEAFTAMRMRGAQITDIAILVVGADDGVMPQTVEAINHAKAAEVDIIVAINKIDLPSANPDRVKQELTEHGLLVEDWGGETIAVPVSAKQKIGIEQLLEMVIIVAEMKELRANPSKAARGSIIEGKLDKARGPVATVLVQDGTLNIGDPIVAGASHGRIRAMNDDKGRSVKSAGPSIPVEIIGLDVVPMSGDSFYVAGHGRQARQLSKTVIAKDRENLIKATPLKVSLDDLFNQIQAGNVKELNVVVKADVQGSVEALKTSLEKLSNEKVRIRTIHGGVGAITETDVMLASASNAIIIGFNVRPEAQAKAVADAEKVDIRLYRVIYSAIDDINAAMKGMLDPEFEEKIMGYAEIRQLFKASGIGTIGGAYITEGRITRNAKVRIVRDGRVVYDGTFDTLRRFKDDVREVAAGYECGMLFHRFNDIRENDKVEAYVMEEIPRD